MVLPSSRPDRADGFVPLVASKLLISFRLPASLSANVGDRMCRIISFFGMKS
jgi:hypothetical protein